MQIAGKVVLYSVQLHHHTGALLLRHFQERGGPYIRAKLRGVDANQRAIFKKGQGRDLDNAPPPRAALCASLYQRRTGRPRCDHLRGWLQIINRFHPLVPLAGILHFVEEVIAVFICPHVGVVAIQNIIQAAELEHGVVQGNEHDALWRHPSLQQGVDHLILNGGLSHTPGPSQDDCSPQIPLLQAFHRFIIGKTAIVLCKVRVDRACGPPGIKRL